MKKASKKVALNTRILSLIMIVSLLVVNVAMISPAFADDQGTEPVEESGGLGVLDLGDVDTGEGEGEQGDATLPTGEGEDPLSNTDTYITWTINYYNETWGNVAKSETVSGPSGTTYEIYTHFEAIANGLHYNGLEQYNWYVDSDWDNDYMTAVNNWSGISFGSEITLPDTQTTISIYPNTNGSSATYFYKLVKFFDVNNNLVDFEYVKTSTAGAYIGNTMTALSADMAGLADDQTFSAWEYTLQTNAGYTFQIDAGVEFTSLQIDQLEWVNNVYPAYTTNGNPGVGAGEVAGNYTVNYMDGNWTTPAVSESQASTTNKIAVWNKFEAQAEYGFVNGVQHVNWVWDIANDGIDIANDVLGTDYVTIAFGTTYTFDASKIVDDTITLQPNFYTGEGAEGMKVAIFYDDNGNMIDFIYGGKNEMLVAGNVNPFAYLPVLSGDAGESFAGFTYTDKYGNQYFKYEEHTSKYNTWIRFGNIDAWSVDMTPVYHYDIVVKKDDGSLLNTAVASYEATYSIAAASQPATNTLGPYGQIGNDLGKYVLPEAHAWVIEGTNGAEDIIIGNHADLQSYSFTAPTTVVAKELANTVFSITDGTNDYGTVKVINGVSIDVAGVKAAMLRNAPNALDNHWIKSFSMEETTLNVVLEEKIELTLYLSGSTTINNSGSVSMGYSFLDEEMKELYADYGIGNLMVSAGQMWSAYTAETVNATGSNRFKPFVEGTYTYAETITAETTGLVFSLYKNATSIAPGKELTIAEMVAPFKISGQDSGASYSYDMTDRFILTAQVGDIEVIDPDAAPKPTGEMIIRYSDYSKDYDGKAVKFGADWTDIPEEWTAGDSDTSTREDVLNAENIMDFTMSIVLDKPDSNGNTEIVIWKNGEFVANDYFRTTYNTDGIWTTTSPSMYFQPSPNGTFVPGTDGILVDVYNNALELDMGSGTTLGSYLFTYKNVVDTTGDYQNAGDIYWSINGMSNLLALAGTTTPNVTVYENGNLVSAQFGTTSSNLTGWEGKIVSTYLIADSGDDAGVINVDIAPIPVEVEINDDSKTWGTADTQGYEGFNVIGGVLAGEDAQVNIDIFRIHSTDITQIPEEEVGDYLEVLVAGEMTTVGNSNYYLGNVIPGDFEITQQTVVPPVGDTYYNLTVNYVDTDGAALAASDSTRLIEDSNYSADQRTFDGYTFLRSEGDATSGVMNGDKEVTFVYSADTVIEESDPPLNPTPAVTETPPATTTPPVQITDAPPPLVALPSDTPTPTEPADPTDPVTIPEPSTPLAGGEETPEVTITEPETPLAAGNGAAWALVNLILTVFTGILSVVLLIGYFRNKREDEEYEDEDVKRKGAMRLFSIVPAIAAIVVFILTEDMSLPMTMVDKWTILMAIIALVQCAVTYMSRKEHEEESENA